MTDQDELAHLREENARLLGRVAALELRNLELQGELAEFRLGVTAQHIDEISRRINRGTYNRCIQLADRVRELEAKLSDDA